MLCDDDFGAQGGDPRRMTGGVHIDLSTCVNFYGPPPAVLERLARGVRPEDLQIHPYAAAERMEALYARHLGVPAAQLVAGRGTTEFIWALSRQVRARVGRRAAAGLHRLPQGVPRPGLSGRAAAVDRAGRRGAGGGIARDRLQPAQPDRRRAGPGRARRGGAPAPAGDVRRGRVLRRLRRATRARRPSSARTPTNLVVLRSPSKFWGIAATRVGVAWCADRERLRRSCSAGARRGRSPAWTSRSPRRRWAASTWAERSRLDLAQRRGLARAQLRELPGTLVERDVERALPLPHHGGRARDRGHDAAHGVGVRVLGRAHGAEPGMLRVLAPLPHQRASASPTAVAARSRAARCSAA